MTRRERIRVLLYASLSAALLLPNAGGRSSHAAENPNAPQTLATEVPTALQTEPPTPQPQPLPLPSGPVAGDLTHLEFTATGNLQASLVSPGDDTVAYALATSVVVETSKGAGVEILVGSDVVPFSNIGKREVDVKTGVTRYTYYGVPLAAGPNTVTLTPLGAGGLRGPSSVFTIYGPGKVASLSAFTSGDLRADGRSIDEVHIHARDEWSHAVESGRIVHVTLVSGDATLERSSDGPVAASATPVPQPSPTGGVVTSEVSQQSLDVPLEGGGIAVVQLRPGLSPGDVVLRFEADGITQEARIFLEPSLRRPFVTGLVQAGVGQVPGIPDAPDDVADGTASRRGRIAVFAVGAVGRALATVAYDTANTLQRTAQSGTVSGSDPGDRPYAVTGDASTRYDDALSRDHLYARVDDGHATAEWGEFRAETGPATGLGGFDQLVDGAKLSLEGSGARATVFDARNDIGYGRNVFQPSGLANGVFLAPNIVVGSEEIILASLNAHTGAILVQTPLIRGVDYTLDYATGALRFIDVPLPFDDQFNPQEIVVTYEFDSPGNSARTVGGRAEASIGHALQVGLGYVNDDSGAGNVTLTTEDVSGKLSGGTWSVQHATSTGQLLSSAEGTVGTTVPTVGGSALNAQLADSFGRSRLSLLYNQTGAGYNNPFGGLSTPGLLNEDFTYAYSYPGARGEIALDISHQSNALGAADSQTTETLRTRRVLSKRVSLTASIQHSNITNPSALASEVTSGASPTPTPGALATPVPLTGPETSTQAELGVDWKVSAPLDLSVDHIQTLSGVNAVQPTQTDAQATYQIGSNSRAYLRERWSSSPIESFATATQALTAATNGTHATEFGIEQRLGPATTVDTTYGLDQSANGSDVYTALGVRERLSLGRVKGDAFFQHGTSVGTSSGEFDVYGTSLTYGDAGGKFRASEQTELRTGAAGGFSLNLGAAGAMTPDLTLLASMNDSTAAGIVSSDDRVGLAWRPAQSDAGATLLQYDRQAGDGSADGTDSGVLSVEQVVRVSRRTEVVERFAYKLDGDKQYEARSSLAGVRVDQKIGSLFDLGVEGRRSNVVGVAGASSSALAIEGGIRIGDHTRLGLGYNVNGSADPALSTVPTHRGFYATVTSVIDQLLGWGHN